jgi:mannose-6-phosphate isomerase-like protein (cupin superfamily)
MSPIDPRNGRATIVSARPWGDIHMVVRNQRCSVDLTHVKPGHRASLHSHDVRYELFHFLDDGAWLEVDGRVYRPAENEEFLIEPGMRHRFWAEERDFRMLVVCFGEWTAEDQTRYEDDYGRAGQKLKEERQS